jgi:hypothetical protein
VTTRTRTELNERDWKRYANSFIAWSESPVGFYPGRVYNTRKNEWQKSSDPIKWQPRQRAALEWLFTFDAKGKLPIDTLCWIDIAKSGKTMIQAALATWLGMFHGGPDAELLMAANAAQQAGVRAYGTLWKSLKLNPYKSKICDLSSLRSEIRFLLTGNVVRPVPMKASTQAGSDNVFIGFDEMWSYEGDSARQFLAEMKQSPTRNLSIQVITTYPGYKGEDTPLNDLISLFFDSNNELTHGVKQPLEGVPLYVIGRTAMWWNHEPYAWHTVERMAEYRRRYRGMEAEFRRIWQAELIQRSDTFIDMNRWDSCTDEDWEPLGSEDRRVPMVLGLDLGVKHDSSALIARGYDLVTRKYPLLDHKIWVPGDLGLEDPKHIVELVLQKILDLHRKHKVIAVYYDPSQAYLLAGMLQREGVNMVEVTQGGVRERADMHWYDLVYERRLRNYQDCDDLREHVRSAVSRRTKSGFRLDKSKTSLLIDGAVADSMACLGISEHIKDFEIAARPRIIPRPVRNVFKRIYG